MGEFVLLLNINNRESNLINYSVLYNYMYKNTLLLKKVLNIYGIRKSNKIPTKASKK